MGRPLPEEAAWHIQKADGYLDLKMPDQARTELDQVPEAHREHPAFRQAELRMAMEREDWEAAVKWSTLLREQDPGQPAFWVQLAYATRRMYTLQRAHRILEDALGRFPAEPVISFNLACYECQMGNREAALKHLSRAEALSPECRAMALEDEDLEPLWGELEG